MLGRVTPLMLILLILISWGWAAFSPATLLQFPVPWRELGLLSIPFIGIRLRRARLTHVHIR